MEAWLRENEHGIKVAVGLVAAIFALVQYFGNVRQLRVEKSLAFFEQFSKEPIFSARTRVLEGWERLGAKLADLPEASSSEEAIAQRRSWKESVVSSIAASSRFTVDTEIMFEFFNSLQICIENDICDERSAHELMHESARTFFGNNCPYVAYVRFEKKITNFGTKAEAFAQFPCHLDIYSELMPNVALRRDVAR